MCPLRCDPGVATDPYISCISGPRFWSQAAGTTCYYPACDAAASLRSFSPQLAGTSATPMHQLQRIPAFAVRAVSAIWWAVARCWQSGVHLHGHMCLPPSANAPNLPYPRTHRHNCASTGSDLQKAMMAHAGKAPLKAPAWNPQRSPAMPTWSHMPCLNRSTAGAASTACALQPTHCASAVCSCPCLPLAARAVWQLQPLHQPPPELRHRAPPPSLTVSASRWAAGPAPPAARWPARSACSQRSRATR